MTQADKTDILNLIANANNLAGVADAANAPYFDKPIADLAKDTIKDAKEVKAFVLKIVQENIQHFTDLSRIRLGGGCWGYQDIRRFDKEHRVDVSIGKNFFATLLLKDWIQRKDITVSYNEAYLKADPKDVVVEKVYNNTSDTSLLFPDWEYPKVRIYDVCCREDLFFKSENECDFSLTRTPRGWKTIKNLSTWTRAKASLLVYSLKKSLVARVNGLRATANEREATREENKQTTAYKKVGL